jgi:hypothetical protein
VVPPPDRDPPAWMADSRSKIREIEANLTDQGIKLFPATKTGERAQLLWLRLKPQLLRGDAVETTVSALHLDLHREELKRARVVLVEMGLIKPRVDGRYVLGSLGPCGRIDELIRDEFLNLKLLESLVILLASIGERPKKPGKCEGRCHD